jgi:hypothetical protein
MKVRVNSLYIFQPVPLDKCQPPVGVTQGNLKPGQVVKVVNLPGAPKANTMGQCYISDPKTGDFLGMVCTNSLLPKTQHT